MSPGPLPVETLCINQFDKHARNLERPLVFSDLLEIYKKQKWQIPLKTKLESMEASEESDKLRSMSADELRIIVTNLLEGDVLAQMTGEKEKMRRESVERKRRRELTGKENGGDRKRSKHGNASSSRKMNGTGEASGEEEREPVVPEQVSLAISSLMGLISKEFQLCQRKAISSATRAASADADLIELIHGLGSSLVTPAVCSSIASMCTKHVSSMTSVEALGFIASEFCDLDPDSTTPASVESCLKHKWGARRHPEQSVCVGDALLVTLKNVEGWAVDKRFNASKEVEPQVSQTMFAAFGSDMNGTVIGADGDGEEDGEVNQ